MIHRLRKLFVAFRDDRSGAAILEFVITLPMLMLFLAIVIEGSRIAWTHQAASAGVRDAARYIARVAPLDVCERNEVAVTQLETDFKDDATDIVAERVGSPDEQILPNGVDVLDVSPDFQCMEVDYSLADIPVVEVRVQLEITFPFGGVFGWFGDPLEPLTTEIADESRVYGI